MKRNMHLPHGPAIPFPGVWPKVMKAFPSKDLYKNIHRRFNCQPNGGTFTQWNTNQQGKETNSDIHNSVNESLKCCAE